jgi:hypothetical protein
MTDDDLCAAFDAATLPKEEFHHREHLRVAFVYLSRHPSDGVPRFCQALLRFATVHGVPAKYKADVTLGYLDRIGRSMREGQYRDSEEFVACHPELLHA